MDIVSLSKAIKVLKQIDDLNKNVIGEGARDRFETVDHRLDWIEGQAEKAKIERDLEIDLSQGEFHNVELIDKKIRLQSLSSPATKSYSPRGIWVSPILDLGYDWSKTNAITILKEELENTSIAIEISSSDDGMHFTEFQPIDEIETPQARYIKLRVILEATPDIGGEIKEFNYDQSSEENTIILNEFVEAKGLLRLKTLYENNQDIANPVGNGIVFEHPIDKSDFKKIERIEVL